MLFLGIAALQCVFSVKTHSHCCRFQSSAYRSNQWRYRGRVDSINFMVDKRIFIVGYGLYGSSSGAADYNVRIELKKYGEVSFMSLLYHMTIIMVMILVSE